MYVHTGYVTVCMASRYVCTVRWESRGGPFYLYSVSLYLLSNLLESNFRLIHLISSHLIFNPQPTVFFSVQIPSQPNVARPINELEYSTLLYSACIPSYLHTYSISQISNSPTKQPINQSPSQPINQPTKTQHP